MRVTSACARRVSHPVPAFQTSQKKKPAIAGFFMQLTSRDSGVLIDSSAFKLQRRLATRSVSTAPPRAWSGLVAIAAEDAQQRQQVAEDVVQIQVNRQRSRDVVGFAAIHDALHVEQHEGGENYDR